MMMQIDQLPIGALVTVRTKSDPHVGETGVIVDYLADDPRWRLVRFLGEAEPHAYGDFELERKERCHLNPAQ